jgi:NADH dehydrogenase FAD-containing subunit
MPSNPPPPRIVVVGGGFRGLRVAEGLSGRGAAINLVDRHNCRVFQPLLYQVASRVLPPGDMATPLRQILRRHGDATTVVGGAQRIDSASTTAMALAWLVWLVVHLLNLVGFRNRASLLVQWMWSPATRDRGVRRITRDDLEWDAPPAADASSCVDRRQALQQA